MKSMATSLNNMAKSMGLRGLSDGLEKVEVAYNPHQSKWAMHLTTETHLKVQRDY